MGPGASVLDHPTRQRECRRGRWISADRIPILRGPVCYEPGFTCGYCGVHVARVGRDVGGIIPYSVRTTWPCTQPITPAHRYGSIHKTRISMFPNKNERL